MTSLFHRYGVSVVVVIASILLASLLPTHSRSSSLFIILSTIVFSAWYGGLGPGLCAIFVGSLGIAYYLMEPLSSLAVESADEVLRLNLFVITSFGVVYLVSRGQAAQRRLARAHDELARLSGRMNMVREDEQARLAREMHDHLGGMLTLLKMEVALVKGKIKDDKTIEDKMNVILKEYDEAIVTIQRIARDLHPSLLDDDGLPAAVEARTSMPIAPKQDLTAKKTLIVRCQSSLPVGLPCFGSSRRPSPTSSAMRRQNK